MTREVFSCDINKITLNITQNQIDSIRKNNITRTACRVYDGKSVGISGFFGEPTEEHWAEAEKNLELEIPYSYAVEAGKTRKEDRRTQLLSQTEFLQQAEDLMKRLHEDNPNFIFSNKIIANQVSHKLHNDAGLDYQDDDSWYMLSIIYKALDSNAVFDGGLGYVGRSFDTELFLKDAHKVLTAFQHKAELPKEKVLPVIVGFGSVGSKIWEELSAKKMGDGSSIFSGKMGKKLFSEQFTLYADLTEEDPAVPFFDMEGSTLEGDQISLIENGVLKRCFCDKKNAADYGFENTACGGGRYDDVPALGLCNTNLLPTGKTCRELLGSGRAIFVDMMAGGDCTAEGNFASPVQLAYLVENGELVGRLPEFNLSGNIYEMFGDGYVGTSCDKPLFGSRATIVKMNIN